MKPRELKGRPWLLPLAALTIGAFALRLVGLARRQLWVDEAATWWFGRLAASGELEVALEPTPPLYYGLIGFLMRVFGESEFVLRLPSVFFGALAVPLVWRLGRELFDQRTAWIAAGLLAVHPVHVYFSREARVYPLLLLLALLVADTLRRALRSGESLPRWGLLTLLLVLSCYSHFYGMFLIATAGVVILTLSPNRATLLRGLAACTIAGLLFLPYLAASLPHLRASGAAWSVEHLYADLPEERRISRVAEAQFFGAEYHKYSRGLAEPDTPKPLRLVALWVQYSLVFLVLFRLRDSYERKNVLFLLAFWILPLAIPWTVNHGRAIFQTVRHDVYALGFTCLVLAFGMTLWRSRTLIALSAFSLLLAGGYRLLTIQLQPLADDHRRTGRFLAETVEESDLVAALGIRRLVSEHAVGRAGGAGKVRFVSFPASTDEHPGWSDVEALLEDEPALHAEGRSTVAALSASRVFVLMRPYQRTADAVSSTWLVDRHLIENLLAAGWRKREDLSDPDLLIAAFERPSLERSPLERSPTPEPRNDSNAENQTPRTLQ